jgi:tetratricopeptide (TPR) repeat protein
MSMYAVAARGFYDRGQQLQAVKLYRVALKEQFDVNIASYLAFILSTSTDDKLRNGVEALEVAEKATKADPTSPTALNSLAAALAENGKFAEAATVAERAIANARIKGETAIIRVTEERVAVFKSGKPLRK